MAGVRQSHAWRRDPVLPAVFTRADARAAGMTDRQISRRAATGVWERLRYGYFRLGTAGAGGDQRDRVVALLGSAPGRDLVVSHTSAAMAHRRPRPLKGWGRPTSTSPTGSVRVDERGHILVAPLTEADIAVHEGLPVTTLARTVGDCLRSLDPFDGLAMLDVALRHGLRLSEVREVLGRQAGWPGVVRAREVAELGSDRRESPLESWSAWALHLEGVAPPIWQVNVFARQGFWCGRVDCWWPVGLAGEADGRSKYALAAAERSGSDAQRLADVLDAERKREIGLRRTRAEVVRWSAADVLVTKRRAEWATHLTHTLRTAEKQRPFTGTWALADVH